MTELTRSCSPVVVKSHRRRELDSACPSHSSRSALDVEAIWEYEGTLERFFEGPRKAVTDQRQTGRSAQSPGTIVSPARPGHPLVLARGLLTVGHGVLNLCPGSMLIVPLFLTTIEHQLWPSCHLRLRSLGLSLLFLHHCVAYKISDSPSL